MTQKCSTCDKHGKTHRRANFSRHKKGSSALKPKKPRRLRVRRWDVKEKHDDN